MQLANKLPQVVIDCTCVKKQNMHNNDACLRNFNAYIFTLCVKSSWIHIENLLVTILFCYFLTYCSYALVTYKGGIFSNFIDSSNPCGDSEYPSISYLPFTLIHKTCGFTIIITILHISHNSCLQHTFKRVSELIN